MVDFSVANEKQIIIILFFELIILHLCWVGKHMEYYYETDETPNPRPIPKKTRKISLKVAFRRTFSPQHIIFRGLGLALYRKLTTRNLAQPNSPQNTYSEPSL